MQRGLRVAAPPPKPLMIYDGDCDFCSFWIRRWRRTTGDAVDYLPAQDPQIAARFPEIPREHVNTAVQLIETDGAVHSGAEAAVRALAKNPNWQWTLRYYETRPVLATFAERAYEFVASHRTGFSRLTRWF